MGTLALGFVAAGLLATLISWTGYVVSIAKGTVATRPVGHFVLQGGAAVLAVVGIVAAPGAATLAVGLPALLLGAVFFLLYSQRRTPQGNLKVTVGDRLLPFAATTSSGVPFHTDSLHGQRVLLKFFRGRW